MNEKITILIPTRNRSRFILSTIKSCLDQNDKNIEIIVSNNCSDDNTAEIVSNICDERVKYIETKERLSMCDHWDFAFNYVTGEYLMVIGDDDAVAPNGIAILREEMSKNPHPIFMWSPPVFNWPSADGVGGIVTCNKLAISNFIKYDDVIPACLAHGGFRYMHLPKLYHSLIDVNLLRKIKGKNGRLFHSTQPDLFMAFTLPNFETGFFHIGRIVTVYGNSAKMMQTNLRDFLETKCNQFFSEYKDYCFEPSLAVPVPAIMVMIADAIIKSMNTNHEYYIRKKLNISAMWAASLRSYKCLGLFEFIKIIPKLRSAGDFSTPVFCFYLCLHKLMLAKKTIMKKLNNRPSILDKCPINDINDAAKWLVSQKELPNWSAI